MFCYNLKNVFKSSFLPLLCLSAFCLINVSCQPEKKSDMARILKDRPDGIPNDRYSDERTEPRSKTNTRCKRNEEVSGEVSIYSPELIDSHNVGEYTLEGRCAENKLLVYVTVNGYKISKNPQCNKKRWKLTLDLTPLTAENDEIVFHVTHNEDTICTEVGVAFLGPKNYIAISPRDDYYDSSFYVMKYEAKIEKRGYDAKALSQPEGQPEVHLSYEDALELCKNNGSRYDLISNEQWQNIALFIEETDENWLQGRSTSSDGNALNCGLSRGNPREASRNDDDDCAVTSCDKGWDQHRRTHLLNTGERIWDMCGNVGEIMKDKYRLDYRFDDFIYNLFSAPRLDKLFGPKRNYRLVNANRRSNTWNLGYAKINKGKDLIVRGSPGRDAGIFSVDITHNQVDNRSYSGNVGFRCVYNP